VNLNERMLPASLRGRVTSMAAIAGRPLDLSEALCTLAGHLHRTLDRRKEHPFAALLKEYDRHHALVGQRVTVTGSDESEPVGGRCDGLDSVGRLLVRGHDRLFRVVAGTVVVG
jgi:biotin-(acetyl-CoA carboxylase) ligase